MVIDKLHWLPIHSVMLMFDQLDCRPIFSVLPAHSWPYHWRKKHCHEPVYVGQWFTFCWWNGNCYVYLQILFQIQAKYQIQTCALLWFSIQIQKHLYSSTNSYLNLALTMTIDVMPKHVFVLYCDLVFVPVTYESKEMSSSSTLSCYNPYKSILR